ncbi:MAG TPA: AraC family transcriptional regulator [Gemmatimonadaceae bacterium]|nr:AraC family transcriptional regulator [Gemmatimonadaceae bacterium]
MDSETPPVTAVTRLPAAAGTQRSVSLEVPGGRVMVARFPGLLRMPPHVHERACVTVVLDGAFTERVCGRDRECRRGTVLAKPGLERHDDRFVRTGSRQIILEPDETQEELLAPCRSLLASVVHFRDLAAEGVAHQLAVELEHPDETTPLAAAALSLELLACAARYAARARRLGQPPWWLERAREMLLDTHRNAPPLAMVAREAGVHPAYLARLFRAHYGCSIGTFVRHRRLRAAAEALATTDEPIAHIALAFGFADQSHFTRLFRRHIRFTPHEYRVRHRTAGHPRP